MGIVYVVYDRGQEALACFDQAILISPDSESVCVKKGQVLLGLGHYEEALIWYDLTLKLNPQFADAWLKKGALLANKGTV